MTNEEFQLRLMELVTEAASEGSEVAVGFMQNELDNARLLVLFQSMEARKMEEMEAAVQEMIDG